MLTLRSSYLSGEGLECRLEDLDFSTMRSLEQLYVLLTSRTKTISARLTALVELRNMANNRLYGPFPDWLGQMTVLRFFNLSSNQLNGSITMDFGDTDSLEVV